MRYEAIEAHCKCIGKSDMECIRFESMPPSDDKYGIKKIALYVLRMVFASQNKIIYFKVLIGLVYVGIVPLIL
ncbi:hypothetical protein WUBG_15352 [Wuchereria bancrofti]|uniref:Uncharacterized protein n=1 Tax=Wuchereria bancrofti TaxID=6293 RepID=J9DVI9_WUCBA|nr:hypothetical protein WUBG_15352 [Wuchereria bancrofti]